MSTDRPKVAFAASLGINGRLGPYSSPYSLVYSRVLTNIGNAYNPSTGMDTQDVHRALHFSTLS